MSLALCVPLLLVAHSAGLSGGDYTVREGVLHARLSFQRAELQAWIDAAGGDSSAALDVQVELSGQPCPLDGWLSQPEEEDGQRVRFQARCGATHEGVLGITLGFLEREGPGHRHYYEARAGSSPVEGIAYRGASTLKLAVSAAPAAPWLGWAGPIWLVLAALGLGAGSRRRAMEVAAVVAVGSVLLVGVGAASAWDPKGAYLALVVPVFAFYLAAEAYYSKVPPRRVALAVPGGLLVALVFLGAALSEGAAEDRVVRGLLQLVSLGLLPGLGLLAACGLASARWPRAAAGVVALAALGGLVTALAR